MFRKLRYALVILAGAGVIALTLGLTAPNAVTKGESGGEAATFGVSDLFSFLQGNPDSVTEEDTFSVGVMDDVTETEDTKVVMSFDEGFGTAGTESPETSEETEKETAAAEEASESTEETEETKKSETKVKGLRAYFRDKAMIDPEKVSLCLRVYVEPDSDSELLTNLYANEITPVLNVKDGWAELQFDNAVGYAREDYLLRGDALYKKLKDTVAYAVMAKDDSTMFYAEPDDTGEIILAAAKSEVYRVRNYTDDYYEVSVRSPIYDTLFVKKQDVLLFYIFLGVGNDNELPDDVEKYLGKLNIGSNLEKAERIQEEAEEEVASYESVLASMEEESKAKETTAWAQPSSAAAPAAETETEAAGSSGAVSLGVFRITNYCHCTHCCGAWGSDDPNYKAHGASGMELVDNYSVAVNFAQIAPGTRLLINGREYIAADSGVGSNCIDIYHANHADALACGMYYAEVFVLP